MPYYISLFVILLITPLVKILCVISCKEVICEELFSFLIIQIKANTQYLRILGDNKTYVII